MATKRIVCIITDVMDHSAQNHHRYSTRSAFDAADKQWCAHVIAFCVSSAEVWNMELYELLKKIV